MNIESQRRYRTFLLVLAYFIVMMMGIAEPICIVRARGLRGLAYVAAHFVGLELVLIISFFVAGLVFGTI